MLKRLIGVACLSLIAHAASAQMLESIEIMGPTSLEEQTSGQYTCIACFTDAGDLDVTAFADWSVTPRELGEIDAGFLEVGEIGKQTTLTVEASYTFGEITKEDTLEVTITPIQVAGFALEFDGDNDLLFTLPNANLKVDEMTVEAWVKMDEVQPSSAAIAASGTGISSGWAFFANDDGSERVTFDAATTGGGSCQVSDPSDHAAYKSEWHHIAVTYSQTGNRMYIDGEEVDACSHPLGVLLQDEDANTYIGNNEQLSAPFHGVIDEVRIWSFARSQSAIKQSMHKLLAGNEPGLVGYWPFNEGSGQVTTDQSPNNAFMVFGLTGNADEFDPVWVDSDAPIVAGSLKSLQIVAWPGVAEQRDIEFQAMGLFDEGPSIDVTPDVSWDVSTALAGSFDGNVLTTAAIPPASFPIDIIAQVDDVEGTSPSTIIATNGARTGLDFDGADDLVEVPQSEVLTYPGAGGWTVEAWIRADDVGGNNPHGIATQSKISCLQGSQSYSLYLQAGQVFFRITEADGDNDAVRYPVEAGAWTHVAGVYDDSGDATELTLYINGQLRKSKPIEVALPTSPARFFLGNYGVDCGGIESLDGEIDEIRVWGSARSQHEIRETMFQSLEGDETGLRGYWRLDEGEGQTVVDQTVNGNDGFLGSNPFGGDVNDPSWASSTAPIGPPACPADYDEDGQLSILDFVTYQNAFVSGHPSADFNQDGTLNILDFVAFQGGFVSGCD